MAFFHAMMDELVHVHPPRDMVPPGWCWKLRKSMYGTRRASRLWADYVMMEDDGSETIAVFSMVFVNRSKRHIVAVWGATTLLSLWRPQCSRTSAAGAEPRVQAHREHRSRRAPEGGEALEPAAGMDRAGLRVSCGHEALPVRPPEAWSRGGEEHERGESQEQGVRYEHPRWRGLPRCAGSEGVRQHRGDLAPPRFGPAGLGVRGGPVDVGDHEAAAEAFGHDEALLEVHGRRCCAWKFDYQEWPG